MGIKDARGEIIAFLDDDTFPAEHWLRHAVVYFFDPRIAAVGGPAVTPGNDAYLARMGGRVYSNLFVSGYYRYRYEPTHVQNVVDFPSCNLLVRKEVLDGLGGFHTEFWPGEDTYLCLEIVRDLRREIVYDPRVFVFHHRRRLFLPHLRQVGRYALHRGYFAKRFPETSRRITYMLPSLFVFGLVAGGVASAFSLYLRALYLSALWTYGLVTFGSCFTRDLGSWLLTWLGVVCTHAVYGVRFAQGLLARRMPGEVRGFDHASEGNP
jgi:GT2 family glycosyltransferase